MKVLTDSGEVFDLGATEAAPTITMSDYSRREIDAFGVTTVVARGFARRMSVRLGVPFDRADAIQRRLAELRAEEATWSVDDRFRWLSFRGFYKGFEIDLATPPLSRCTLEVEGLAETETLFDAGGDPAAEGAASTLRLIQPTPITDAMLAADSVAENDHPEWSGTDSYAVGARVIKGATHRIYESVAAANVGADPTGTSGKWLDVGPTNRWSMFDQALGTATTAAGEIGIILNAAVTAVALLDVVGATVQVQAGGYDRTITVDAGPVVFLDVPATGQVVIRVTGSGTVSVGTLLVGRLVSLGVTEASPTAGITDYSRKEIDAFGDVSIVERSFAKRMTARALIRTDAIDAVANRIASVRGRPAMWIGQSGLDSLTIYGFFKDFSIEVGENVSKLSVSVEGLTKATPRARPATVLIPRGFYDPAETYRNGDFVQYEGSSWLYTAPGESSGNVPPTLPDEENAYWRVLARAGRIGRDGVSAYAILLTNENHILPANADGTIITYNGASTDVVIYSAGDDVTGSFLLSVGANPQGLAVTTSGATATVTGGLDAAEANATVTLRMTGRDGYAGVVLEKVFSLTKSRAGADGKSPALLSLRASTQAVRYAPDGTFVAGQSVTFTATRQNVSAGPYFTLINADGVVLGGPETAAGWVAYQPFAGRFTSTSPDDLTLTAQGLQAFLAATSALTMRAYPAGLPDVSDVVTAYKVKDGQRGTDGLDALVGYLTNESHVVPCSPAGAPLSYAGAKGQFRVFFGLTEVTNDCAFAEVSNSGAGVVGSGGFNGQSGGYYQADELTADVGTVLLRATYRGTSIDKAFTLTKSRAAIDGTSPALISLSASRQTVQYDKQDVVVSGPITFTTIRQNSTETPIFRMGGFDGVVHVEASTEYLAATFPDIFTTTGPDNLTITQAWARDVVNGYGGGIKVVAKLGGTGISDTLSLPKIKDGADGLNGQNAYSMVLTNEAVVLPATSGGEIVTYAPAATSIQIFRGSLDVTAAFASATAAGDNPQRLSIGGAFPAYQVTGGFDVNETTAALTFRATGSGAHAGVTLTKTMTLTKSRAAIDGTSPPLLTLDASTYTLRQATDGSFYAGQSVTFTASRANTAGPTRFQFRDFTGAVLTDQLAAEYAAASPTTWSSPGPDVLVWSATGAAADMAAYGGTIGRISVRAYVAGTSASDTVSVQAIRDGQKGADGQGALSAFLSNESFTYAVNAAGQPDAVPAGVGNGRMRVFKGAVEVTGSSTFTAQVPGNLAVTIDGAGNYTTSHLYGTGGFAYLIASYEGQALVLTLTGAKSVQGGAGANAKSLYVTSTSQTITVDAAGNLSPAGQDIVFRAIKQNTAAPVTWRAYDQAGQELAITYGDSWTIFGTDALNIINHGGAGARTMTVVATLSDGVTLSDTVSVVKVPAGANGDPGTNGTSPPILTIQASSQVLKLRADGSIQPFTPGFTFTAVRQNYTGPVGFRYTDVAGFVPGGETQNGDVLTVTVERMRDVLNAAVAQGKGPQIVMEVVGGGLSGTIGINLVVDGATGPPGPQGPGGISAPQPVALTEPDGALDPMLLTPGQVATVFYRAVFRNNQTGGTVTIQIQYRVNGGGWNVLDQRAVGIGPGEPAGLSWAAAYGNNSQDEQTVQFRAVSDAPGGTEVSPTTANYLRVQ